MASDEQGTYVIVSAVSAPGGSKDGCGGSVQSVSNMRTIRTHQHYLCLVYGIQRIALSSTAPRHVSQWKTGNIFSDQYTNMTVTNTEKNVSRARS